METRINNSANQAGSIESITSKREALIRSFDSFVKSHSYLWNWGFNEQECTKIRNKILSLPAGYSVYIRVFRAGGHDRVLKAFPEELFSSHDHYVAEHYIVGFELVAATGYKIKDEYDDFWRRQIHKVKFGHGAIMLADYRL